MRKEETMTDDFQNVLRRVIAAQPKIYLSGHEGYYRHADIARLLQALTAWNTRPDEGEPVAWRWRAIHDDGSKGSWVYETGSLSRDIHTRLRLEHQPLYTRPAPALDREGVARALHARYEERARRRGTFNAETDHTILGGRTLTDCSPSLRQSFLEDADAILAMVGGGVPAGEDAIKAAYMRGWNDREADFLERADAMGLSASTVEG